MVKEETKESREAEKNLIELQLTEQGLQNLLMQKQAFQLELIEIENALSEIKKIKQEEDIFKIVGTLMFKSSKKELAPELEKKCDLLNLRMKAIEKQEQDLKEKLIKTREELIKKIRPQPI